MKQFLSFVIKEAKHILRDKRTMLILFGMPVVLMFIFGFAITTDVKNVRTSCCLRVFYHHEDRQHPKRGRISDTQSEGGYGCGLRQRLCLKKEWHPVYR